MSYDMFEEALRAVKSGRMTPEEMMHQIKEIVNMTLLAETTGGASTYRTGFTQRGTGLEIDMEVSVKVTRGVDTIERINKKIERHVKGMGFKASLEEAIDGVIEMRSDDNMDGDSTRNWK